MKRRIVSVVLSIIMIFSIVLPTYAASNSEKKSKLESQISNAKSEKAEVSEEKASVLEEIDKLNSQISEYESQISELNKKVDKLQDSIKSKEKEIKKLETEFEEKEQLLAERLVAMYEAGQTTYLDVLLSSDGIANFISNYYMAEQLAEADQEVMNSIMEQQTTIEKAKKELEEQKKEISESKKEVEAKNEKLTTAKASKQAKVNSLSSKEKKLQAQIDEYESDLASVEAAIKNYEQQNSSSSPQYTGGKLAWPVPGYYSITSYYGYRIHPIYGYSKLHTGIDVGAPKNAKFVAAEDGVVISASYSGGYGNRVIISHGGGLSTLYAHGTSILVSAGQTVKRGDPVLTVGSTGLSTGNHAHFEVRVNGNYVDPLNYLQ